MLGSRDNNLNIEGKMSYEFTECLACEKLPGQAALCEPCLANRQAIAGLTADLGDANDKNDLNLVVLAESLEERDTAQRLLAGIGTERDHAMASLQNLTATIAQQSEYIVALEIQREDLRSEANAPWWQRIIRIFSPHFGASNTMIPTIVNVSGANIGGSLGASIRSNIAGDRNVD